MSETTNTPATQETKQPLVEGVDYAVETSTFSTGIVSGLKFQYPEFKTLETVIKHYGAERVLGLLNTQIHNRIKSNVLNSLPKANADAALNEKAKGKVAELITASGGTGIVHTIKDALEYMPDSRGESAPALFAKANKIFSEPGLTPAKLKEAMDLMDRAQKLLLSKANVVAEDVVAMA